jgi:hypothetical protein
MPQRVIFVLRSGVFRKALPLPQRCKRRSFGFCAGQKKNEAHPKRLKKMPQKEKKNRSALPPSVNRLGEMRTTKTEGKADRQGEIR